MELISQERLSDWYLLLWDFCLQIIKSLILLIFHNFYVNNVLYHCCTKSKDQYEPSRRKIHTSVSLEHGMGVAGHTSFQKVKRSTDYSSWIHSQLLCLISWNFDRFVPILTSTLKICKIKEILWNKGRLLLLGNISREKKMVLYASKCYMLPAL